MANTGAQNPTTGSSFAFTGSNVGWSGETNVTSINGVYAQVGRALPTTGYSNYLFARFDFSALVPANATILGYVAVVTWHSDLGGTGTAVVQQKSVKLVKAGAVTGNELASVGSDLPVGADDTDSFGSSSSLNGATLTPSDVGSNFGLAISVTLNDSTINSDEGTAFVDHVQMTIYYADNVTRDVTATAVINRTEVREVTSSGVISRTEQRDASSSLAASRTEQRDASATLAASRTEQRDVSSTAVTTRTEQRDLSAAGVHTIPAVNDYRILFNQSANADKVQATTPIGSPFAAMATWRIEGKIVAARLSYGTTQRLIWWDNVVRLFINASSANLTASSNRGGDSGSATVSLAGLTDPTSFLFRVQFDGSGIILEVWNPDGTGRVTSSIDVADSSFNGASQALSIGAQIDSTNYAQCKIEYIRALVDVVPSNSSAPSVQIPLGTYLFRLEFENDIDDENELITFASSGSPTFESTLPAADVTADAAISRTEQADVSATLASERQEQADLSTALVTERTEQTDVTTDGAISTTGQADVTTDGAIGLIMSAEVATDLSVEYTPSEDVTADAAIERTEQADVSADAVIGFVMDADVDTDAPISVEADMSVDLSAVIERLEALDVLSALAASVDMVADVSSEGVFSTESYADVSASLCVVTTSPYYYNLLLRAA